MTKKVTFTFVVGVTKFKTKKGQRVITGGHDLLYDPEGHTVNRGRRSLRYNPKGHGVLCDRFDLVFDPKRPQIY